ncbi:3-hexulose-6-phosphate synthase [Marinococcus sp. PL1-022]|uniref:3-hexulose-6-phosphate synthase n=1 Tax=Marinococcus sp. PL1-022 TaxID=3095363 RepID=UPI0029C10545|nr:3-hexulose-6-phosphate synthase [Marinococcus sp. PL1-022]MDX6154173.1 3-hexulose-6-phosphate synthase [Marinococcus sp. PL1-022]
MNIQLALDRLPWNDCFKIVHQTEAYIDWIEIGTGVIKEYGMDIVRQMKREYPDKVLVADMKTCDAARAETIQAFGAGADVTTVMAFASDASIQAVLETAEEYGKKAFVDLLNVREKQRLKELDKLGIRSASLHIGKDMQQEGSGDSDYYKLLQAFPHWEVSAAGGLQADTLYKIKDARPDVIIIGGAITKSEDPRQAAEQIRLEADRL